MKKIMIVTPAPRGSLKGNRITALRWADIFKKLGFQTEIHTIYQHQPCQALVALHARKSAKSVQNFKHNFPNRPLILALTGTDLYHDIHINREAQQSLQLADKLILLQPLGLQKLNPRYHSKTHVIYQSVSLPTGISQIQPKNDGFNVCVVGHLREVKDPMRAAYAARLLPESSRIRVVHIGAPLTSTMVNCVKLEENINPRYKWLGEMPRHKILRIMAKSHLLIHSSLMEGGANVISEAIAVGVPILASDIPGNKGLLEADYPGYFPTSDTEALRDLMLKAENDIQFYQELKNRVLARQSLVQPSRELNNWKKVLKEFNLL